MGEVNRAAVQFGVNMGAERRISPRLAIEPVDVTQFTSLDHLTLISRSGQVIDASATGFLMQLRRDQLVPKALKESLSLTAIEGDRVIIYLKQMNLEIIGRIARTKRLNKDLYEIAIDFSEDSPEYWRECLVDLLPRPGEFD
jgi:hypothetical protein